MQFVTSWALLQLLRATRRCRQVGPKSMVHTVKLRDLLQREAADPPKSWPNSKPGGAGGTRGELKPGGTQVAPAFYGNEKWRS